MKRPLRKRRWVRVALLAGGGTSLLGAAVGGLFLLSVVSLLGVLVSSPSGLDGGYVPAAVRVHARTGGTTQGQEEFAGALVACSRLDPLVVLAWTLAEGGGVNPGQPANNFLFLSSIAGGFREFASPAEAAAAVCLTLGAADYAVIRAAAGLAPILQLLAIAESPWDGGHVPWGDRGGHYGGRGENLVSVYYSLIGSPACPRAGGPC